MPKVTTGVIGLGVLAIAMNALCLAPATAAPSTSTQAVTVPEGARKVVQGQVPIAYRNSMVVLETVAGSRRQELGWTVSNAQGRVSIPVAVGGAGEYKARWRVVRNGKTKWASPTFALDVVKKQGAPSISARAERVFEHSLPSAASAPQWGTKARSSASRSPRSGVANEAAPVAEDSTDVAAEAASKSAGQTMKDLGTTAASNAAWDVEADGVTWLFNLVFKRQAAATAQQVQQLSNEVQTGFATVEAQLDQLEAALAGVQQQVTTVQNEVVQSNASAAASTCTTVLGQANTYVDEIQNVFGNFQTTVSPQWVNANLVGQSPAAGITVLGDTIYGTGAGIPSFADGVTQLQTTVTALGKLLNTDGPVSSTSLLGACSSALVANIDVQYSQAQTEQNLQQSQAIIPAGAVDQDYFDGMQALTSYYTGWLAVGQTLAARGGLLGVALLQGTTPTTPAQLGGLCAGQSPQPGSALTCGGILANLQQSTNAFDNAWANTGASWYDVTNGLMVADTKAGNASDFFTPAKNLWVQDIARYGESLPLAQTVSTTTTTTAPGLAVTYNPTNGLTTDGSGVTSTSVTTGPGGAAQLVLNVMSSIGTINVYAGNLGTSPTTAQLAANPAATFTAAAPPCNDYWGSYCSTVETTSAVVTLPLGTPNTPQAYTIVFPYSGPSGNSLPQYTTLVVQWTYTGAVTTTTQGTRSNSGTYTPSGPLVSTSAAANVPAAGISGLATGNWLGFTFTGANTATWQSLIPTGSQPANSAVSTSLGSLMYQAGLLNGGRSPSGLLLYTGESGSFNSTTATNWFSISPDFDAATGDTAKVSGQQNFSAPAPSQMPALSFLDTNVSISPGVNPVVSAPSGSTGYINNLGNVMSGGSVASLPVNWCTPPSGKETCSSTTSWTSSLSQGINATQNNTFYSPYSVAFSYDISFAVGDTETATLSDYTSSVTAQNSTMAGQTPQTQYLWPVSPLQAGGRPSGSNCTMTTFTQGVDGNAGVTNVCADLFQDWMAGAIGVSSGPVSITSGGYQGTLTSSGNNVLQALLTNTSTSAQNVTLYARGSNGAQVGTLLTAGTGGSGSVSNIACVPSTDSVLECVLTVPSGTSVIDIPLASSNGTVTLAIGSASSASSSVTQVASVAASLSELPGAVQGLTAAPGNASGSSVTLQWIPPTVNPPVSGYTFVLTSPTGSATSLSTSGASPVEVTSGVTSGTVTATIPLPSDQSGVWRIGVSATNPAGSGPLASVTATLGSSAPATPTNFQAVMNANGTIDLTWNPVTANPTLSNYAVQVTTPGTATQPSATQTIVSNVPAYTIQNVSQTGRYTFALTAVNSLGASAPTTTNLNVTGMVPTQPQAIDLTVDSDGWISVTWLSSSSVPTADSYQVGLFQPGSTSSSKPVTTLQVTAPVKTSTIRVPDLYQLGKNSPTGAWFVIISPSNSVGVGEYGTAQLVVTNGVIARATKQQAEAGAIAAAPSVALSRARAACTAGSWTIGFSVFGTCTNGVFIEAKTG